MKNMPSSQEPGENESKPPRKKPKPNNLRITKVIPRFPYKSQAEKWDACLKAINLDKERQAEGLPRITDTQLKLQTGMNWFDVFQVTSSREFKDMRAAKAKADVMDWFADFFPQVKRHMAWLVDNAKTEKERNQIIQTMSGMADKFGFSELDTSKANPGEMLDVAGAVKEGISIVLDITGKEVPPQVWIKSVVNQAGSKSVDEAILPGEPDKTSSLDGAVETVLPVPPPVEAPQIKEKIPPDDRQQPPREDRLADV